MTFYCGVEFRPPSVPFSAVPYHNTVCKLYYNFITTAGLLDLACVCVCVCVVIVVLCVVVSKEAVETDELDKFTLLHGPYFFTFAVLSWH